jgi:uncharacterized membrane protein
MIEPIFLDTVITPTRSLTPSGRGKLIGVFAALSLASALIFFRMGASPVVLFVGLVVAALGTALNVSGRQNRAQEHIRICTRHVRVSRRARGREALVWESPTHFTRVSFHDDDFGAGTVKLRLSGRELEIASELSRTERQALVRSVEEAIRQAKSLRYETP